MQVLNRRRGYKAVRLHTIRKPRERFSNGCGKEEIKTKEVDKIKQKHILIYRIGLWVLP